MRHASSRSLQKCVKRRKFCADFLKREASIDDDAVVAIAVVVVAVVVAADVSVVAVVVADVSVVAQRLLIRRHFFSFLPPVVMDKIWGCI